MREYRKKRGLIIREQRKRYKPRARVMARERIYKQEGAVMLLQLFELQKFIKERINNGSDKRVDKKKKLYKGV